jgi:hypothetical protein
MDPMARGADSSSSDDDARVVRGTDTVGSYRDYASAQEAVDFLSDRGFPVDRLRIVGEDLRTVERVTGRLTTGRAALAGAGSGAVFGGLIGLFLGLFTLEPAVSSLILGLYGVLLGTVFGALFGAIGHAATRGRRDFSSVQGMVAGRYDVVAEADVAARATSELAELRARRT